MCSGQLRSEASPCHGYNENDRRAICIEDLRDDVEREEVIYQQLEDEGYFVKDELKALLGEGERERSKRRRGTCGLGALASFRTSASLAHKIPYHEQSSRQVSSQRAGPVRLGTLASVRGGRARRSFARTSLRLTPCVFAS